MWSDLYVWLVEWKWEQSLSIKLLSLHGGSGGIGPNADTTINKVDENKSGGKIDLLGCLGLEISTDTIHVPRENGNGQLLVTVTTTIGDTWSTSHREEYCQPCKNVPSERYRFNCRVQEPGETYNQYRTALLKIAEGCEFQTITHNEILRDRLVFGIRDNKARERLLRKSKLTLVDTDEVHHAAESTVDSG